MATHSPLRKKKEFKDTDIHAPSLLPSIFLVLLAVFVFQVKINVFRDKKEMEKMRKKKRRLWRIFQKKDNRYKTVTYRRLHVVIGHLIHVHKKNGLFETKSADGTSKISTDNHSLDFRTTFTFTSRLPVDREKLKPQRIKRFSSQNLCFYSVKYTAADLPDFLPPPFPLLHPPPHQRRCPHLRKSFDHTLLFSSS